MVGKLNDCFRDLYLFMPESGTGGIKNSGVSRIALGRSRRFDQWVCDDCEQPRCPRLVLQFDLGNFIP